MDVSALIKKLWHWFDDYFLLFATAFLIAFIPLYPKIPLADLIPATLCACVWRISLLVWWSCGGECSGCGVGYVENAHFLVYFGVFSGGSPVELAGVYLTQTIPPEMLHVGKSMLHWIRHIQYLSLFFIAYNSVKNRKQAIFLVIVVMLTLLGVIVYGYGQKYLYWPVFYHEP